MQNGMQNRKEFMPSIYASFGFTTTLNVFFGAFGYALWGKAALVILPRAWG